MFSLGMGCHLDLLQYSLTYNNFSFKRADYTGRGHGCQGGFLNFKSFRQKTFP